MARWFVVLGIALALDAVSPGRAAAQNPQTRQGFFASVGLGFGSFGCGDCDEREGSGAAVIYLGGTLNPQLLLGGEVSGWTKEEDGGRRTHSNLSASVQFYPSATSGFFVRSGIGGSSVEIEFTSGNSTLTISDEGFGATAGLGYDIRVGSNFSVTPYATFAYGSVAETTATTFQGGVAATFH
jgi:hypothetical protein